PCLAAIAAVPDDLLCRFRQRLADEETMMSGSSSSAASSLPIFGASFFPRLFNGRSWSSMSESFLHDLAWRSSRRVFMAARSEVRGGFTCQHQALGAARTWCSGLAPLRERGDRLLRRVVPGCGGASCGRPSHAC